MTIKQNKKTRKFVTEISAVQITNLSDVKEPTTILASNCVHACAANQNLEEWNKDPSDYHSFLFLFLGGLLRKPII
jgi:hypothetical protein